MHVAVWENRGRPANSVLAIRYRNTSKGERGRTRDISRSQSTRVARRAVCGGVATPAQFRRSIPRFASRVLSLSVGWCASEVERRRPTRRKKRLRVERGRSSRVKKKREREGGWRGWEREWQTRSGRGGTKRESRTRYWCACLSATTRTNWTCAGPEKGDRLRGRFARAEKTGRYFRLCASLG